MNNKKIIIADIKTFSPDGISIGGHSVAVAHNYMEIFGGRCIVAGGYAITHNFPESRTITLPYCISHDSLLSKLKIFINSIVLFRKAHNQIIVLQQSTTITAFLCIALFHHCSSKLFLIQYNLEGFRSKVGRLLFKLAKRKINGIICPYDMVGKAFQGIPYCIVPDYIYTGSAKEIELPFTDRKYDFCIVGRLSPEKGVVEVAQYFSGTKYRIVIAGKPQSEEMARQLETICKDSENIKLHLGIIPDNDYYGYLRNSKYALLNYSGEYSERSSGVVFDTLFNGVPVVGRECKALHFITENQLGLLYDCIEDLNLKSLFQEEFHSRLVSNIQQYRKNLILFINKLSNFLLQ